MSEGTATAAASGPAVSWPEVAERLRPFIARRVASPEDADDVLQDTLLRMHRGLRGGAPSHLSGWMHQVARSALVEHHRRRARADAVAQEAAQAPELAEEPRVASPDDEARAAATSAARVAQTLPAIVGLLPEPYREALRLTELEGLTQREAAARVGVSLSGMKSRVQRGRDRLRDVLEALCVIDLDARGQLIGCEPRPPGERPACACD